MSDLYDDEENELADDLPDADIDLDVSEITVLDARRRLEKKLEEKRLRDELDDFVDYQDLLE